MELAKELMDKVNEIVEKLKADPGLLAQFKNDPVQALEKLTGIDLPQEQLQPVIAAVKAKLGADDISGLLGGLKGLF